MDDLSSNFMEEALSDGPSKQRVTIARDDAKSSPSKSRDVFAVEFHVWKRVLSLGINPAVCFLILARGSDQNNSITRWSVDAIERYTNISRQRAKEAVEDLQRQGILELIRGGKHPIRRIRAAHEVPGCPGYRGELTPNEAELLSRLPLDESALGRSANKREVARQLVDKGHAQWVANEKYRISLVPQSVWPEPVPAWVWLPNALVDGASEEVPPIELVRQTQSLPTLRALVDVYYHQSLQVWGGVDPLVFNRAFEGSVLGERGQFRIWRFQSVAASIFWEDHMPIADQWPVPQWLRDDPDWRNVYEWDRRVEGFYRLVELGLAEWIPCIFEGDGAEAEMVYPTGIGVDPAYLSDDERLFTEGARAAALTMLGDRADQISSDAIIAPVALHIQKPHMRGILRTRYRAHTTATQRWCAATTQLRHQLDAFNAVSG